MNARQRQILDALDIAVWALRGAQPSHEAPVDPSTAVTTEEDPPAHKPGRQADAPGEPAQVARSHGPDLDALDWGDLERTVAACTRCGLCKSRKQTVFAAGQPGARWMVIGEAPGADEDQQGEPFVGQAGKLLDNMLRAVGAARDRNALIANVLKCRPPGNRNPEVAEVAACSPYLLRQIELAQPDFLLLMGKYAASTLLRSEGSIALLRGRCHYIDIAGRLIPAVVTYHPAYLLRQPEEKAKAWADLKLALRTVQP